MRRRKPWRHGLLACLLAGLAACGGPGPSGGPLNRKEAPSLLKLGDDLQRSGDPEGALTMFRAASAQGGRNGAAFGRVGQESLVLNDPARAEQAFRAAMKSGDSSVATRRGLAIALLAQGQPGEALPLLAELAERSRDAQVLRTYGVALDMTGHQAEAQATYRRGLDLSPADADLHGNLALSLAASGQMEAALGEMRAATYAPVADPRQEVNQVLLLAIAGRDAEAREQGRTLLGPARTMAVMQQAARVRVAPDAAGRAAALGLMLPGNGASPAAAVSGPARM